MSTLAEIEAAAEALPRDEQEKLFTFLMHRLREATESEEPATRRRSFEPSAGRCVVTNEDVYRAEEEEDEQHLLRR